MNVLGAPLTRIALLFGYLSDCNGCLADYSAVRLSGCMHKTALRVYSQRTACLFSIVKVYGKPACLSRSLCIIAVDQCSRQLCWLSRQAVQAVLGEFSLTVRQTASRTVLTDCTSDHLTICQTDCPSDQPTYFVQCHCISREGPFDRLVA